MNRRSGLGWVVGVVAVMLAIAFAGASALAQHTPAGTQISNQAVAEYKDTDGISRVANSNIVYVTVKQIAGVEVSPSDAATVDVLANQTVHYSFSVRNAGNGPDNFTLKPSFSTDEGWIEPESLELYRDINGNGVIDAGDTKINTSDPDPDLVGPIASGATAHFIARFRVPADADAEDKIGIDLTAESNFDENKTDTSAAITFQVVTKGVLSSTLQARSDYGADTASVKPPGEITYTITALNQGMQPIDADAATVTITIPAELTFKPKSLKVNGDVQADLDEPGDHVIALPTINGGQAAVIEYVVQVPADYSVGYITNQVTVKVADGTPATTNEVQTRVLHVPGVELTHGDGDHEITPTEIGKTYEFPYTVQNSGNGPDRIFIEVEDEEGWTIAVYGSDGLTELPKQSGKYTVGNLAGGESADFIVKVTVPTHVDTNEDGINIVKVSATSEAGGSDDKTSVLENFHGAGVTAEAGDPEESGEPGTVVEYTIEITNDGPATDLFDLTTANVPKGYVVEFFDGDGNPISDISIPGGNNVHITVRVTIPSDAGPTAPDNPESFKVIVTSQNNPDEHAEVDLAIGVKTVVAIEIAPNRTGAANRGGFTTYTVKLTNLGNDDVTVDLTTEVSGTKRLDYVFLGPVAPHAVIGPADQVTLGAGKSMDVMVRVDVPSQVAVGTMETARIVATVSDDDDEVKAADSATVTTTVLGGELQLEKKSDVNEAAPGGEVTYTITAKNISVGQLTDVVIYEKVPEYTTFDSATADADVDMDIAYSDDNGATWNADPDQDDITDVKWELNGALAADAQVVVTMTVKVK